MYYVYVLLSQKDGRFYTGFTKDLRKRFSDHNCPDSSLTPDT